MVLPFLQVTDQLVQAAVMVVITLASISMHHELAFMRRASDNIIALLAQYLVFVFVFVLLLRIVGMFENEVASAVVGTLLCLATMGVFVAALALANKDRVGEQRATRQRSTLKAPETSNREGGDQDEPEQAEVGGIPSLEAGSSQGRASSQEDEEKVEEPDAPLGLPWSLLSMGNNTFCGADITEGDYVERPATAR